MPELGEVKRKIAEYEAKNEIEKAIAELKKAVQDFPKEGSLFNKLGDLYLKVKDQKNALDTYEKGARVFKEETYFPNAIALCKKILRLDQNRTETYYLLGELHKELDQRGEAANYLLEYADRKIKNKDLESALNAYNTVKELVPNNPKILQTISAIYEQMGKKGEAAEFLKEAKRIESEQGKLKETITPTEKVAPSDTTAVKEKPIGEVKKVVPEKPPEVKKEEIKEPVVEKIKEETSLEQFVSPEVAKLLKDEEKQEAEVSIEKEETEELSEIDRTVELGELYLSLGYHDEAIDCFRNAANDAWERNDYGKAFTFNRRIADLRPFDLKSRQHLIEIAKMKGDKELHIKSLLDLAETLNRREAKSEAHSVYRKILEIDPNNIVAHEMLAAFEQPKDFIDLGEVLRTELEQEKKIRGVQSIDELISEFRREIFESIGEGDYHSHYDLGVAYKGMGLFQEAIEEFGIARKDENLKMKTIEMIGSCFLERDKIEDALNVLNEGLKINDRPIREYFGIHFLIGKCYEKRNNLTQALKTYLNAYNIDKTVPDLITKINELKDRLAKELSKRGRKIRPQRGETTKPSPSEVSKPGHKKSRITYL